MPILRAFAAVIIFACTLQAQQAPLPPNILDRDDGYLVPSSLEELWQRSKVVALVKIQTSEQKSFRGEADRYPRPYLRHSAKVLRVWKGDALAPRNSNIRIAYPGGTVVHHGTTIVTEAAIVVNVDEQVLAFLTDYPATESYGFTFGPAGVLVFDKNVEKAKVTKNLAAFAFPNKQALTQNELFGAIDRLAKGKE